MVGQNEGQGAFGNDLTNVMTADSQEELARRFLSFVSFFSKELWNSRSNYESSKILLSTYGAFMSILCRSSHKVKLIAANSAVYRFHS